MKKYLVVLSSVVLVLFGCRGLPPPDSDSSFVYSSGSSIPVDENYYEIVGVIDDPVGELIRQKSAGKSVTYTYAGEGFHSSTYFGPELEGKGFARVMVESVSPATPYILPEKVAVIKITDTKARQLMVGDRVKFKCRLQYEAVAALESGEVFQVEDAGTWEVDYCRLASPVID